MPAKVTKIVASPTRNTLRADQRMSAAIISAPPAALKRLQRRLQIAFGVDQEGGRGDDLFALASTPSSTST